MKRKAPWSTIPSIKFFVWGTLHMYTQCRLNAWPLWAVVRGLMRIEARANLTCMLCTACYLMVKHWFCWKYQYNIRLILSTIYIFITVSGCVGRGPSALFCLGHIQCTTSILHTFGHKCIDNERPASPEKLEHESSEVASML